MIHACRPDTFINLALSNCSHVIFVRYVAFAEAALYISLVAGDHGYRNRQIYPSMAPISAHRTFKVSEQKGSRVSLNLPVVIATHATWWLKRRTTLMFQLNGALLFESDTVDLVFFIVL